MRKEVSSEHPYWFTIDTDREKIIWERGCLDFFSKVKGLINGSLEEDSLVVKTEVDFLIMRLLVEKGVVGYYLGGDGYVFFICDNVDENRLDEVITYSSVIDYMRNSDRAYLPVELIKDEDFMKYLNPCSLCLDGTRTSKDVESDLGFKVVYCPVCGRKLKGYRCIQ